MKNTSQPITRYGRMFSSVAAFAGLLALSASSALAGFITPVSVAFGGVGDDPISLINGNGLSGGAPYTGVTHQSNGNHADNFVVGALTLLANPLTFDLGGLFDLTHIDIWNFSHNGFAFYTERDSKNINVSLSTDGATYTFLSTVTLTSVGVAPEPLQRFAISGNATHVRLQVTSIFGNPNANGIEGGLGEVRFEGTSAVPEPGTYALVFGGLAVLGAARLRTRLKRA